MPVRLDSYVLGRVCNRYASNCPRPLLQYLPPPPPPGNSLPAKAIKANAAALREGDWAGRNNTGKKGKPDQPDHDIVERKVNLKSQVPSDLKSSRKHVDVGQEGPHLRFAGVDLLARVDGADAADAGHGGAGVQGAAGQAGVVEEALGAQRALHRPAEGILAHWVLHSGEILHAFIQGELTGFYRKG